MSTVYIETSIIGYVTSRPSRDAIVRGRQLTTIWWWTNRRQLYDLVTSAYVIDESSRGDADAAAERIAILDSLSLLDVDDSRIEPLADELLARSLLPQRAKLDALHVATAAVHAVEYLMTWNCRHIANADQLPRIYRAIEDVGFSPPLICTPEEFSSDEP